MHNVCIEGFSVLSSSSRSFVLRPLQYHYEFIFGIFSFFLLLVDRVVATSQDIYMQVHVIRSRFAVPYLYHTPHYKVPKSTRRYFKENHLFPTVTVTSFSSQLRPTRVVHHAHSSSARPLTNHAHCSPRQHALNLSPS